MISNISFDNGINVSRAGKINTAETGATYRVYTPQASNVSATAQRVTPTLYIVRRLTVSMMQLLKDTAIDNNIVVTHLNNSSVSLQGDSIETILDSYKIPTYAKRVASQDKLVSIADRDIKYTFTGMYNVKCLSPIHGPNQATTVTTAKHHGLKSSDCTLIDEEIIVKYVGNTKSNYNGHKPLRSAIRIPCKAVLTTTVYPLPVTTPEKIHYSHFFNSVKRARLNGTQTQLVNNNLLHNGHYAKPVSYTGKVVVTDSIEYIEIGETNSKNGNGWDSSMDSYSGTESRRQSYAFETVKETNTQTGGDLLGELIGELQHFYLKAMLSSDENIVKHSGDYEYNLSLSNSLRNDLTEVLGQISDIRSANINWYKNEADCNIEGKFTDTFKSVWGDCSDIHRQQKQLTVDLLTVKANSIKAELDAVTALANNSRQALKNAVISLGNRLAMGKGKALKAKRAESQKVYRNNKSLDANFIESEKIRVSIAVNAKRLRDTEKALRDTIELLNVLGQDFKKCPKPEAIETVSTIKELLALNYCFADRARDTSKGEHVKAMQQVAKECKAQVKSINEVIARYSAKLVSLNNSDAKVLGFVAVHSEKSI